MLTTFISRISEPNHDAKDLFLPMQSTRDVMTSGLLKDLEKFKEKLKIDVKICDQFNLFNENGRYLFSIEINFFIPVTHIKSYFLHYCELFEAKLLHDQSHLEDFSNKTTTFGSTETSILNSLGIPLTMMDRYKFKIHQYMTELEKVKSEIKVVDVIDIEKYNEILGDLEGNYEFDILIGSSDRIPSLLHIQFASESKKWIAQQL